MTAGAQDNPDPSRRARRKLPRQARSELTVDNILQATVKLAEVEGFQRLTTPRIAAKAGVSIGSLYQYFSSREAIYATLYEKASSACALEVRSLMMKMVNEPPESGMPAMVEGVLRVYERNSLLLLKLIADQPAMRERSTIPTSFEALVRASIKLYVQMHLPTCSERELETRLFLMESGVVHAIQRYALERPPLVLRRRMVEDLANTVVAYIKQPTSAEDSASGRARSKSKA